MAKGLRGAGNICVILDEVAHFTESGQSGAEEVYNAVVLRPPHTQRKTQTTQLSPSVKLKVASFLFRLH